MATTRREFLSATTAAGAALFMNPLENLAKPSSVKPAAGYSLTIMATNWGFGGSWDEFCAKAKKDGYDGAEIWWPGDEKDRAALFEALAKYNLKIAFLWGSGEKDFAKHEAQFQQVISEIAKVKPLYINCHSGKDYFSADQKNKLITFSNGVATSSGIPVYHETHRGRALYSAPVTKELMDKNANLRLTLDVSHWCNVHESLLQDQAEAMTQTLERTDHIHARIGHPEGPQVNDPRAPEWDTAVNAHFAWWDQIVARKKSEGKPITFLTEFGPPDYLPTLPYTRQPLANQWDINVYMLQTIRKRYA